MAKRTTTQNKKPKNPSSAPMGVADEAQAYRDDSNERVAPADNLYDAIRAEVDRLGGGFILKPLKRYRHRSPRKFHPR